MGQALGPPLSRSPWSLEGAEEGRHLAVCFHLVSLHAGVSHCRCQDHRAACSRLRLAEDRSGNSYFQPQTAVRMVNRKRRRESTLGPQRDTAAPLSVCLVIHLCHQPPVNEHVRPGRCWEQPGELWGRQALRWADHS